jgi:uncharacterized protein (DUF952 family)
MIYHVTTQAEWELANQMGEYVAPSLDIEGFIHCSREEQVAGVLERYYSDVPHLILLHIEEKLLKASLIVEMAPSVNEIFPHIYGPINLDAVVSTSIVTLKN